MLYVGLLKNYDCTGADKRLNFAQLPGGAADTREVKTIRRCSETKRMKRSILAFVLLGMSGALFAAFHAAEIAGFGNEFSILMQDDAAIVISHKAEGGQNYEIRHFPDGSYEGVDADGHHFVGDGNTGFFLNYGTGR